ncbi:hypothetical protein UlMin_019983 [Ulmus minor]
MTKWRTLAWGRLFFIQEFHNWDSAWALEALYVIAYEIRILVERGKGPKRVGALYVSCQSPTCIIQPVLRFSMKISLMQSLLYFPLLSKMETKK